jgi:hypothetical protein
MSRSTNLIVVAVLFLAGGILCFVFALLLFGGYMEMPPSLSIPSIPMGIFCLAIGGLSFALGWGLLALQEWARIATILFGAIGLLVCLLLAVLFLASGDPGLGIAFLALAIIMGLVVWYLMQPSAVEAFQGVGPELPPRYPAPPPARPRAPRVEPTYAVAERPPAAAWLAVQSGPQIGRQFSLRAGRHNIGRDSSRCQVVLDDPTVSGEHAKISFENGQFVIYDLGSYNGTFVNRQRVQQRALMDNDEIQVGNTVLIFKKV